MDNLTEEQRKKIIKLLIRNSINGFFLGVRYGLYFGISIFITVMLDNYYVKSSDFQFFMGIVNAIFLMHFMLKAMKERREKLKVKLAEIIKQEK